MFHLPAFFKRRRPLVVPPPKASPPPPASLIPCEDGVDRLSTGAPVYCRRSIR